MNKFKEDQVNPALSLTDNKCGVHYEYAKRIASCLSLPLFTASALPWFLSLVLFNISLWSSWVGSPAPSCLTDTPLLIVPQHFINHRTTSKENPRRRECSEKCDVGLTLLRSRQI